MPTKRPISSVRRNKPKTLKDKFKSLTLVKTFPILLIVMSLFGMAASLALTLEELAIYKNPNHHPSCSLNPVVSCGPVMKSREAHVIGSLPNPYIGIAAFAIILCVGATMLAGAKMKKWYWLTFQAGATGGMAFVLWLMFHSIYILGALCIYCMTTWVVVSTIFWYLLQWNLVQGNITIKPPIKRFMREHHGDIIIGWFILIVVLILNHFWYYFGPALHFVK